MQLNEAIQHLKDELANPAHDWGCEECRAEHEQLLEWLEDYKQLKQDYIELDKQLRNANTENDELKCLLSLAVYDVTSASNRLCDGLCDLCECSRNNDIKSDCKWRYHDEAMKLIGGNENT